MPDNQMSDDLTDSQSLIPFQCSESAPPTGEMQDRPVQQSL